jgi:hypothetical protein
MILHLMQGISNVVVLSGEVIRLYDSRIPHLKPNTLACIGILLASNRDVTKHNGGLVVYLYDSRC